MRGLNKKTGGAIDGVKHIKQSIADILSTPQGTRVMRRDYGSLFFALMDLPLNDKTFLLLKVAIFDCITKWEPRVAITQINLTAADGGKLQTKIDFELHDEIHQIDLTI